jgi:hypothetical protein
MRKLFCFCPSNWRLSPQSTPKHQNCDLFQKTPGWRTMNRENQLLEPMNQLSLRNNRLKFTSSGESYELDLKLMKENWKLTCDWLDLKMLGSWPIVFGNLLEHCWRIALSPSTRLLDSHPKPNPKPILSFAYLRYSINTPYHNAVYVLVCLFNWAIFCTPKFLLPTKVVCTAFSVSVTYYLE